MKKLSPDDLRKLKDKAAEAAAKGKLDKAAELYREAADGDARDVATRQKLAEVLRRAGRIPEAIQAYREVADRFGRDGLLIKAIAISKTILELDPSHEATQAALAELYAQRAKNEGARPAQRTVVMQAMKAAGIPAAGAPALPAVVVPPPPEPKRAAAEEEPVVALPLGPPEPEAISVDVDLDTAELGAVKEPDPFAPPPVRPAPPRAPPPVIPRAPPPAPPTPPPVPAASLAAPAPPPLPAADEPPVRHTTAFAQIVFAAEAAVEAGVEEDIVLADAVEVTGDEPLTFATTPSEEPPEITAEAILEPPPEPDRAAPAAGVGEAEAPPPELEILPEPPAPAELEILVEPEPVPVPPPAPPAPAARPAPPARPAPAVPTVRPPAPPAAAPPAAAQRPAPRRPAPPPPPPPAAPGLPRVPIFSDLSRDAFVELTAGMVLHRVAPGESVIREGEDGTSFYVVATGKLAVTKRDDTGSVLALARLGEGDFFGEMALLSGTRRSATVTAEEPAEVLEFRAEALLDVASRHPHVAEALRRFYRQRLLANAMAVSPIFRPFPRGERKLIMERFRARETEAGEVVIREGEPSDGLYVILEGAVDVTKLRDGQQVVVSHLREGDLFGEMSCLRKAPASAKVVVTRAGTLLRLPRKDFDDLVVTYPQILELVSTLSDERAENLDAILSGHAEWTEEGLVLT